MRYILYGRQYRASGILVQFTLVIEILTRDARYFRYHAITAIATVIVTGNDSNDGDNRIRITVTIASEEKRHFFSLQLLLNSDIFDRSVTEVFSRQFKMSLLSVCHKFMFWISDRSFHREVLFIIDKLLTVVSRTVPSPKLFSRVIKYVKVMTSCLRNSEWKINFTETFGGLNIDIDL